MNHSLPCFAGSLFLQLPLVGIDFEAAEPALVVEPGVVEPGLVEPGLAEPGVGLEIVGAVQKH